MPYFLIASPVRREGLAHAHVVLIRPPFLTGVLIWGFYVNGFDLSGVNFCMWGMDLRTFYM